MQQGSDNRLFLYEKPKNQFHLRMQKIRINTSPLPVFVRLGVWGTAAKWNAKCCMHGIGLSHSLRST